MNNVPMNPPDALGDIALFLRRVQWAVVAFVACWLVWVMAPILTPFVVAAMLGWLGDPLVDRVQRSGRSRNTGVILVFALMTLLVVLALLILVPMIQRQVMTLIESLPTYRDWFINTAVPWVERRTGFQLATWLDPDYLIEQIRTHWERAGGFAATALAYISRSGFALFASLANIVLIPVLTFFFLRDWDVFVAKIAQLIPRTQLPTVSRLAKESSNMLGGFLRGQFTVMLILGAMYGLGLWAVGLDLGLLIGIVAGLLTFVPYLGPASGVIFGVIAALVQYGDWKHVAGVLAVFGVGQVIESYWLTPKLVGDRIGLHPVAVIFAVLAGGQLFGFLGMLLALPVAAVANVLLHYAHERYTDSRLYAGEASPLVVPAHVSSGGIIVPGDDAATAAQADATPRHSDDA